MDLPTLISRKSPFQILGVLDGIFLSIEANSDDLNQTPHYATSDLDLRCCLCLIKRILIYIWASTRENLSSAVCEQHRHRLACTSAQSDQRLIYSLIGKYDI